jgi:hypothetical protein
MGRHGGPALRDQPRLEPVVLRFEWNAMRPGDRTLVHDAGSSTMALVPGVVEVVDPRRGDYGIGIRMPAGDGSGRILWPSSRAVHRGAVLGPDPCWRCELLAC